MRRSRSTDRVLATVLLTDIVGSTERAAEVGDRRWRELVGQHHSVVRAQLKRFRGREIDTAGDGFFATFDRPAQAIECAVAIVDGLRPLGLVIRAGIHAGELELSDGKLGGIAVPTAARVMAAAGPGDILVTATVRELVAGTQIQFVDRGMATLKGVPGEWHLYAVLPPPLAETPPGVGAARSETRSRARARLSTLWAMIGVAAVVALGIIAVALALPRLLAAPLLPGVDTVARVDGGGAAFDRAVRVGSRPAGLAAGDGAVWAINFTGGTLQRVDLATGEAAEPTAVGGTPTGIAYGSGAVWITTGFGLQGAERGSLVRFSANRGGREGVIDVGSGLGAVAFAAESVWVGDQVGNAVIRINPSTNAVEREVPVARQPVAVAGDERAIWVASSLDNVVQRLDPVTYQIVAQIPVTQPTAIAVGPSAVWVTSELGDALYRIDATANTSPIEFQIGDGPRGVAVTADAVWVALGTPGRLLRVDPATGAVEESIEVDGFADALVVDEEGRVWVSVRQP